MTKAKNILYLTLFLLGLTAYLSSCKNFVYEELPLCSAHLRFVYEHNMKFADAFPHEVKKVNLYIYDDKGVLVSSQVIEKEPFEKDFLLPLELNPGKYKLLAWAGLYEESYNFTKADANTAIEQLGVSIKNNNGVVNQQLNHLWYGAIDIRFDGESNKVYTLPLMKDTNTFRIAMLSSNKGATPIDMSNYEISISEDNGAYTHQNQIVKGNPLTYLPYIKEDNESQLLNGRQYAGSVCEMRTGRLIEKQPTTLKIRSKITDKLLLDIDLTNYLAILRMQDHANMPLQEYLDRQDEYNITFFFTDGTTPETSFLGVQIFINGWLIRTQNIDG